MAPMLLMLLTTNTAPFPRLLSNSALQSMLFSAGYDGKMFIWDTSKPKTPAAARSSSAPISSACQLSPNVFVAACIDGSFAAPALKLTIAPSTITPVFRSNSLHDFRAQSAAVKFGKRPKGRPLRVVRISDTTFAIGGSGKR